MTLVPCSCRPGATNVPRSYIDLALRLWKIRLLVLCVQTQIPALREWAIGFLVREYGNSAFLRGMVDIESGRMWTHASSLWRQFAQRAKEVHSFSGECQHFLNLPHSRATS